MTPSGRYEPLSHKPQDSAKIHQWGPWVAAGFAIVAATIQKISVDRKSDKTLPDSGQKKKKSLKDLWKSIWDKLHEFKCWDTLHEFKYWLVEGSLHEPLKSPTEPVEDTDAKNPSWKPHRTFRGVQIFSFPCDRCKARPIRYQCTDCDQGYCTDCWPRTQKRGAQLEVSSGERAFDAKHPSILVSSLTPPHSATSSSQISPTRTPTEYLPLRDVDIEEGSFHLPPNILPSFS